MKFRKIVAVSDSLTNELAENYLAMLGKGLGVEVVAEAHGGWSTESYFRERFKGVAFANVPPDADLCIILMGSNNLFEDEGGSEKSIAEAVAGVQRVAAHVAGICPGVRFLLVAPPSVAMCNIRLEEPKPQRRIDAHTPGMLGRLSAAYRELAKEKGWMFADLYPVLRDEDFVDAAHPGVEGNRKMAVVLERVIAGG